MWEKIKHLRAFLDKKDIFTSLLIIVVSLTSFVLGQLSVLDKKPLPVTVQMVNSQEATANTASMVSSIQTTQKESVMVGKGEIQEKIVSQEVQVIGKYVASKSGTKYHLPTCSGAKRISDKNKIWFSTKEEAEQAGYTPASNCKGI